MYVGNKKKKLISIIIYVYVYNDILITLLVYYRYSDRLKLI